MQNDFIGSFQTLAMDKTMSKIPIFMQNVNFSNWHERKIKLYFYDPSLNLLNQ